MIKFDEGLYFDENIKCTVYRTELDCSMCNTYGYLMKDGKPVLLHIHKATTHYIGINNKTYERILALVRIGNDERLKRLFNNIQGFNDCGDITYQLTYNDKDLLSC